jgi:hypothetical protein
MTSQWSASPRLYPTNSEHWIPYGIDCQVRQKRRDFSASHLFGSQHLLSVARKYKLKSDLDSITRSEEGAHAFPAAMPPTGLRYKIPVYAIIKRTNSHIDGCEGRLGEHPPQGHWEGYAAKFPSNQSLNETAAREDAEGSRRRAAFRPLLPHMERHASLRFVVTGGAGWRTPRVGGWPDSTPTPQARGPAAAGARPDHPTVRCRSRPPADSALPPRSRPAR